MRFIIAVFLILAPLSAAAQQIQNLGAAATATMNDLRAGKGLAPVEVSDKLTVAAAGHASDMAQNGFFSHTGSDGSGIGDRARAAGYGFCFIAENIAQGQGGLAQVMESWMGSTGHRRNILAEGAREFALVRGAGDVWVMVLGRPGC